MDDTRILIIDDEKDLLDALSARLRARGNSVDVAESGEEALEMVEHENYDAVVLDLAMPGIDGLETLKRIREINSDLQVVLLTGHATVQKGVEAIKLGAVDLLEKPTDFDVLLAKIVEASSRKAALSERRVEQSIKDILKKKGW